MRFIISWPSTPQRNGQSNLVCSAVSGIDTPRVAETDRHGGSRAHSLFHKQTSCHQSAPPDPLPAVYEHILAGLKESE